MGGELNLKNGKITMPDGEVYGLNIRFPMNYENEALQVASANPFIFRLKIFAMEHFLLQMGN